MKLSELNLIKQRIDSMMSTNRIWAVIEQIDAMLCNVRADWQMSQKLERVKENYSLLSKYALDGVMDPNRAVLYDDIKTELEQLAACVVRKCESEDSSRQYFGIMRYEATVEDSGIHQMLDRYEEESRELDAMKLGMSYTGDFEISKTAREVDDMADRLFRLTWVTHPLSSEDVRCLHDFMLSDAGKRNLKFMLVSAIMLGCIEYYDDNRIALLADIYRADSDSELSIRALVALLLAMWMNRSRLNSVRVKGIVDSLRETVNWKKDLKSVFLICAQTRDTERITKKMRDDVIPSLIDIQKNLKLSAEEIQDVESLFNGDYNPEWAEKLEKSGIGESLKELTELQEEGADVMMATFAHMKGFPFFHEIGHWFMPFDTEHSDVLKVAGGTPTDLLEFIADAPMMCDSDRYSLVMSLEHIPSAHRRAMIEQFKEQSRQMLELKSAMINPDADSRGTAAKRYIQDLYRFFNLYQRKQEFNNPFSSPINFAAISVFSEDFDTDMLRAVAEFYFSRGYYAEALELFEIIVSRDSFDAELLQKQGYCLQRIGQLDDAIVCYKRSELLSPDSEWTISRLAYCYRKVGKYEDALVCLKRLAALYPEDVNIALQTARCLAETGQFEDALKEYFRAEFYYEPGKMAKAYRPLARCLMSCGQFDRSEEYLIKAMADEAAPSDYLNMGHIQMINGRYREAENYYKTYMKVGKVSFQKFEQDMSDAADLFRSGHVDTIMIDLVKDHIFNTYFDN